MIKMPDEKKLKTPFGIPVVTTKLEYNSSIYSDYPVYTTTSVLMALENKIANEASEKAYVIGSDSQFNPVVISEVGIGNNVGTPVSIRDIIRTTLLANATYVTFVHNHPGSSIGARDGAGIKPSKEDVELTYQISKACAMMGMYLYDSIIVQTPLDGQAKHFSMRDKSWGFKKWMPVSQEEILKMLDTSKVTEDDIEWGKDPNTADSKVMRKMFYRPVEDLTKINTMEKIVSGPVFNIDKYTKFENKKNSDFYEPEV